VREIRKSVKTGLLCDIQANHYIEYLNREIIKSSAVCVLNVYFSYVVLKKQAAEINRFLEKRGLKKKRVFYIPVFNNEHWFFVRVGVNEILICDSFKRGSGRYLNMLPVSNIVKFSENILGRKLDVVIDHSFPQQAQSIDCGYFMLSGLKDCIEGNSWSFTNEDIATKKAEIARVLIAERNQ
jgi:Ulp1 family protease